DNVLRALGSWQECLVSIKSCYEDFMRSLGVNEDVTTPITDELQSFIEALCQLPTLNGSEVLDVLPNLQGENLLRATQALQSYTAISNLSKSLIEFALPSVVKPSISSEKYVAASEVLTSNVEPEVSIGETEHLLDELELIFQELEPVHEQYEQTNEALGLTGKRKPSFHADGLRDFAQVLELVDSLPQRYLYLRS